MFKRVARMWREFWQSASGVELRVCPWCNSEVFFTYNAATAYVDVEHADPLCEQWIELATADNPNAYLRALLEKTP